MNTIFISYSFTDDNARALYNLTRLVATKLRQVTIVDGNSLGPRQDFSVEISTFIKDHAQCVVAIFTADEAAKLNVIYELGVAVGADKEIVIMAESPDAVPGMLRRYDIVAFNRNKFDWQDVVRTTLEKKFRSIFQPPGDVVEEKIKRRYQPEELRYLRDQRKVEASIQAILQADLLKADAILKKLIEKDPTNFDARFLLADCTYLRASSSQNPSERESLFNEQYKIVLRGLESDRNHVLLLHSKGQCESRMGKFEDASKTLLRLLELDPKFSLAHYNLSCLMALQTDKEQALKSLADAIGLNEVWRDFAKSDRDFASFWNDKDWIDLVYV
jgi:tetratricopeptide (TPR) repeat protein